MLQGHVWEGPGPGRQVWGTAQRGSGGSCLRDHGGTFLTPQRCRLRGHSLVWLRDGEPMEEPHFGRKYLQLQDFPMTVTRAWDRKLGKYREGNRSDQPTNPAPAMLRSAQGSGASREGQEEARRWGAMRSHRPLKIRWEEQELGAPRTVGLSLVPLLYSRPKYLPLGNTQVTCEAGI